MSDLVTAADAGDALEQLRAMRSIVARAVADEDTPARDLAALTRRLMEINREIEGHEPPKEGVDGEVHDGPFDPEAL